MLGRALHFPEHSKPHLVSAVLLSNSTYKPEQDYKTETLGKFLVDSHLLKQHNSFKNTRTCTIHVLRSLFEYVFYIFQDLCKWIIDK